MISINQISILRASNGWIVKLSGSKEFYVHPMVDGDEVVYHEETIIARNRDELIDIIHDNIVDTEPKDNDQ